MKFSIFTAEINLDILHGQIFVMIGGHKINKKWYHTDFRLDDYRLIDPNINFISLKSHNDNMRH